MKEPIPRQASYGWVMSMRGPEAEHMLLHRPSLFRLLTLSAWRTLWCSPEGRVKVGEALVNPPMCGLTRQEFRCALRAAVKENYLSVVATVAGKNHQGTIVKLSDTRAYEISKVTENPPNEKRTLQGIAQGTLQAEKRTVQETTQGTLQERLRYANGDKTGTAKTHRNGEPKAGEGTLPETVQGTTEAEKGTLPGTLPGTHLLKNLEENKKEEDNNLSAAAPLVGRSDLSLDSPETPEENATILSKAYPGMVKIVCGQFTAYASHTYEQAVEFFTLNKNWGAMDVTLVGLKALIATKSPPGENDRFWWSRKYAKDLPRLVAPTREEESPIIGVAREVGYDTRHYTPDELAAAFDAEMEPYIRLYDQREAEKKSSAAKA